MANLEQDQKMLSTINEAGDVVHLVSANCPLCLERICGRRVLTESDASNTFKRVLRGHSLWHTLTTQRDGI